MNKFCIVGMGFIYPRHKNAIEYFGGEVYLTCDIDKRKKPDFTDWVEMFNHPKFDKVSFVSICTPNYLHSTITREALLRGKRVLCEKPLSINGTEGMEGVKTVLQLRYHPKLQFINNPKQVHIEARMFRNEQYWDSWKGNEIMSGGVLYNLGVHYIDLLVFLLGDSWTILEVKKTKKMVSGKIRFRDSQATFLIEVVSNRKKQGRKVVIDGEEISLSDQDNLSYEDLHRKVYENFLAGMGVSLTEAKKSIKLIGAILNFNAKSM